MKRDAKIKIAGIEYSLLLTGAAVFAADELLAEGESIIDIIHDKTPAGWNRLCHLVGAMAEQGELVRRFYGHKEREMLDAEKLALFATPIEAIQIRTAALDAILKAYRREEENENEEVDLGLAELEKKSE